MVITLAGLGESLYVNRSQIPDIPPLWYLFMPKSKPEKPAVKKAEKAPEPAPATAPKAAVKKVEKTTASAPKDAAGEGFNTPAPVYTPEPPAKETADSFGVQQRERLLALRDDILDSMNGVAKDTLRSRAEGSEASAFGMHQADAGSDAYDRDFALSLLSQEQDALYEIEEALKRIEQGTYGVCEMSGKPIATARLEALPFARYTVECQAQLEKQTKLQRTRTPVTSLFGLTDSEESAESEEEETPTESKD